MYRKLVSTALEVSSKEINRPRNEGLRSAAATVGMVFMQELLATGERFLEKRKPRRYKDGWSDSPRCLRRKTNALQGPFGAVGTPLQGMHDGNGLRVARCEDARKQFDARFSV
ncbi:hypothetical protein MTO96_017803 [Rhipicephalus appendiculatus]